ncbi:hypothetical protein KAS08_03515 [Candidatus Pacearchaeota archaeon]|nr:hypothetical protein [Candidatus Pacearchaeota archaeon]
MVVTITDIMNTWNQMGVFSYVLPFLLIFAIVYAILEKTKLLASKEGDKFVNNKGITAIIAVSVSLLSLQFDFVSEFFAVIFPRFGIGLSLLLVFMIFIGFFLPAGNPEGKHVWFGWAILAGVIIWALSSWGSWSGASGFGGWFVEYIWAIVIVGIVVAVVLVVKGKNSE